MFSRERAPILTLDSGDTLVSRTLDAAWGPEPFAQDVGRSMIDISRRRDPEHDTGHCLVGPIAVRGAEPGMTLEVQLHSIQPGPAGSTWVGEARELMPRLGIEGFCFIPWQIDVDRGIARSKTGQVVELQPFLGVMGVAPAEPGYHSTMPPRACGGNIDCRELVAGSRLYLPIRVPGALFSFGDGHGAQGDGEIGGTAIESPMSRVELSLRLRQENSIAWPRAVTPSGWITFGFHSD
jgi:acetamidase/formamidase